MPGHIRDLRKRTTPYNGPNPHQARWHNPQDPRQKIERSFPTKQAARQWMAEADHDAKRGQAPLTHTLTLQEAAQDWYARSAPKWQETTAHSYRSDLDAWLTPPSQRTKDPIGRRYPLSQRRLTSLTAQELQAWRDQIARHRSPRTAAKLFAMLGQVLKFAVRQGDLHTSPAQNVEPLHPNPQPSRPYSHTTPATTHSDEPQADPLLVLEPQEITKLAQAFEHPDYRAAVAFDAVMGLRAGELWALRRKDFNPSRRTVTVARAFKQVKRQLLVGPVKTKAARRVITLPETTQALIDRHLATVPPHPDALVFTDPQGDP